MMSKTFKHQPEEKRMKTPQEDWRKIRDEDFIEETEPKEYPEPELDYVWKYE